MARSMRSPAAALAAALVLAAPAAADPGTCVTFHCGIQLAACLIDTVCRTWSDCNQKCKSDDLACQMRCGDLYKPTDDTAAKITSFSECVISDNHCVPQMQQTCQIPANAQRYNSAFELGLMSGDWYITRGWNPLFDCFDCQYHTFTLSTDSPPVLKGDIRYWVKQDLACQYPDCQYLHREVFQSFRQDSENQGHLMNHNNTKEELHYSDDWYVLAAKPDSYALIYYCGCNDAICGYSGAVLYTRASTFEALSDGDKADIRAAVEAAQVEGFNFDGLCSPNNAGCSSAQALQV